MVAQKPPWFRIDAAQFLSDTLVDAMSTVELGACFRLLLRQWMDGYIPDDPTLLARLCRLDEAATVEAWVILSRFFPVVESGKRANRFMWIEREKVSADLERRSDEGTRAARKRWDEVKNKRNAVPIAGANGSPMPMPLQEESREEKKREPSAAPSNGAPPDTIHRAVVALLLKNGTEYPITLAKVDEWKTLYPAVNVMQQLRNMKDWLAANQNRRKTAKGILRFITRWLITEQDARTAGRKPNGKANRGNRSGAFHHDGNDAQYEQGADAVVRSE